MAVDAVLGIIDADNATNVDLRDIKASIVSFFPVASPIIRTNFRFFVHARNFHVSVGSRPN